MRRRILLACACAAGVPLASFVSPAFAQPDLTQKAGPSVADAPSDSYRFDRFELDSADGGRRYRVQLAVPRAAPPPSGFPVLYLLDGNELVLGPFEGRPSPHTHIPLGRGICGAAAAEKATIIVDDVNADPRYLACSLDTKSEIVVPIMKGAEVLGESLLLPAHTAAVLAPAGE